MRTATITELKNRLSALIDRVRAGESILILDRGTPVARLGPAIGHDDQSGRLRRLERAGIVKVGTAPPPVDLILQPPPKLTRDVDVVAMLIEERRSGR